MNSHSWIINGVTCLMSRYHTFNAANHRLTPNVSITNRTRKSGASTNERLGNVRKYTTSTPRKLSPTAKSRRPLKAVENGKAKRGKYTFVMRFELDTSP